MNMKTISHVTYAGLGVSSLACRFGFAHIYILRTLEVIFMRQRNKTRGASSVVSANKPTKRMRSITWSLQFDSQLNVQLIGRPRGL